MKTELRLTVASFGLAAFNVSAATLYVSLDSPNPTPPFTNWVTAARVIQDAVDAAKNGDTVLVTNGVYSVGEREISVLDTNQQPPQLVTMGPSRVVITNAIRLESVNGPLFTTIQGEEWVRCVYLGDNAVLSGFTLTKGSAKNGGGVLAEVSGVVTNCILTENRGVLRGGGAFEGTIVNCIFNGNSAKYGGGADESTLYNCILTNNSAKCTGGGAEGCIIHNCTIGGNTVTAVGDFLDFGAGAYNSTLYNCVLTGNWAPQGGGTCACVLNNCTLTGNSATGNGGGAVYSTLYNCVLADNWARWGGGASGCVLYNCVLTDNSADSGGGASGGTLFHCIVYYNTAPNGANYLNGKDPYGEEVSTLFNYSCTTPLPINGVGNITGPPLFMDMANGDFRLREDSPCIDAGTNLVGFSATVTNSWGQTSATAYTHDPTDFLGNTRFIDGDGDGKVAWDIGAYEFNSFKPPRFSVQPQRTANGWRFTITGAVNKWVGVQRSSDFKGWWDLKPPTFVGEDGFCQVTDEDKGPKVMFYRAVVVSP